MRRHLVLRSSLQFFSLEENPKARNEVAFSAHMAGQPQSQLVNPNPSTPFGHPSAVVWKPTC